MRSYKDLDRRLSRIEDVQGKPENEVTEIYLVAPVSATNVNPEPVLLWKKPQVTNQHSLKGNHTIDKDRKTTRSSRKIRCLQHTGE